MLPARGAFWLVFINFLFSLGIAVLAPIFPLYVKTFVNNNAFVGYVSAFIALVLLFGALTLGHLLKYVKKFTLLMISLLFTSFSYYLLMVVHSLTGLLILIFFRTSALIIVLLIIGLYIRESVKRDSVLGKTEGFYFTFMNLAWLIGPLMGGALSEKFGANFVFGIGSGFTLLASVLAFYKVPRGGSFEKDRHTIFANVKEYFANKNLLIIYLISIGLACWWPIIYTFLPLYLAQEGAAQSITGYALFLVVLPLIILELPVGKLADKLGFKKFFNFGFLILMLCAALTYFVQNYFFVIGLLVFGSVGIAFIEPLREAYLFKTIKKKDTVRFSTIYATAFDVGSLISPLMLSSILYYTNFKITFLSVAVFMFFFMIVSRSLREL